MDRASGREGEGHAAPSPPLPFLGRLLEPIYRAEVARRNRAFDEGRGVVDVGVPVISVGNISLGGTGKTPMVMQFVEWLLDAGRRPAIAMRGYGARDAEPSDEARLYRERFPGLPLIAQPRRSEGLLPFVAQGSIDCAVLDDGFQHRQLARALDLVLVDASRSPFEDRCLPAGWLREPVESLGRAGAVVITHAEAASEDELDRLSGLIERAHGAAPLARSRHAWSALRIGDRLELVEMLRERRLVVACAIGNPRAFLDEAHRHGALSIGEIVRRDHHRWTSDEASLLAARMRALGSSGVLLTTEKDWVKLRHWAPILEGLTIARPVLLHAFDFGAEALRAAVLSASAHPRSAP